MPTRKAEAEWRGNLAEGSGRLELGSGAFGLARSHIAPGVIADATTGLGQCSGLEFPANCGAMAPPSSGPYPVSSYIRLLSHL